MSAPDAPEAHLIYVDLIESKPVSREAFDSHPLAEDLTGAEVVDKAYSDYLDRFQPWRLVVLSGGNFEPLFRSTESYFNREDAIHAAEIAFGSASNVSLREREKGNVALRYATRNPTLR